jgi:pyrroloquinoline quinone (PQQ) biosynthesis protein C
MACGGRLPQEKEWVRGALAEYIEDEYGHQEWILNDLAACGADKEAVRNGQPDMAIELMVAFLYDQISRQNPMAFFGMVMVLEGTSIKLATQMGKIVQQKLNLPDQAFSYLYSHGELDQDHFEFFRNLMDKVTNPDDQQAIIHSANVVYHLYGDMLRCIPLAEELQNHEAA